MPARNTPITNKQIERFKQRAKLYKKETGTTHAAALDAVAKENGFSSWKALLKESDSTEEDDSDELDQPDLFSDPPAFLDTQSIEIKNKVYLAKLGIEYAIFIPTETGLKKSILDATGQIRTLFELSNFHFYQTQRQGKENKIIKQAYFLKPTTPAYLTKVSLYRPATKQGDPRMWFSTLSNFVSTENEIAVIILEDKAFLINISKTNLEQSQKNNDFIGKFLNAYRQDNNKIAEELLSELIKLAKNPIAAIGKGDTAVGMAIEFALKIAPNSSKTPDYKGIEIKSGRGLKNRSTLFAQVPIWKESACKSSAEILEKYGYMREVRKKLYCTVSTQRHNSQGLIFSYDEKNDVLHELDKSKSKVAIWSGDLLRARLKEKHTETFWIEAKSKMIDGKEYFQLISVIHTKAPILAQLMQLIDSGVITMDHLISKDTIKNTGVREKGPLFKINKHHLNLLFPQPVNYLIIY